MEQNFETAITAAAQKAILKMVMDGSWVAPEYNNRFKVPPDLLADVYKLIDRDKLMKAIAARLEHELADRIVNHMAAEIATDIKQILSVKERREALRHIAREHMDAIMRLPTGAQPGGEG